MLVRVKSKKTHSLSVSCVLGVKSSAELKLETVELERQEGQTEWESRGRAERNYECGMELATTNSKLVVASAGRALYMAVCVPVPVYPPVPI